MVSRLKLPAPHSRAYTLLKVLYAQPGTFWQTCERAGYSYDSDRGERASHVAFESLLACGQADLNGITYSISVRAKVAMDIQFAKTKIVTGTPVAAPYRPAFVAPITITRRSA